MARTRRVYSAIHVWGGNENAQGTRKRDHLRGRKAHDRGGTAARHGAGPVKIASCVRTLCVPLSGHPNWEGSGFRVCGEAVASRRRLRSLTTPYARVSRSSRQRRQPCVKASRSHPHRAQAQQREPASHATTFGLTGRKLRAARAAPQQHAQQPP